VGISLLLTLQNRHQDGVLRSTTPGKSGSMRSLPAKDKKVLLLLLLLLAARAGGAAPAAAAACSC